MRIDSTIILNNGVEIPILGLGTFQSQSGDEIQYALRYALDLGYRHFDTAVQYGNEADVGKAIRESGVALDDIFITTKVLNEEQGYENTLKAFDNSLLRLGLDYVDLYLLHWPLPGKRLDTWRAMCKIYEDGRARAIGISNFTEKHIDELMRETPTIPAINQIEMTPFLYQKNLAQHCQDNGIQVAAYGPFSRGKKIDEPKLKELANKYGRTPAQMLLRWSIDHNFVVIPKSVTPSRIKENSEVFDFKITKEDLDLMDSWDEGFRAAWNPYEIIE